MATVKWTQAQVKSTKAAENTPNLFGTAAPSRADKMRASRKATTDLTKRAIDYLNSSGMFEVHRSNNIPSPIIKREWKKIKALNEKGQAYDFRYEAVQIMFKKGNIKKKILDISGFSILETARISKGIHIELEVKTGKDELDEGQIERMDKIKKAGGVSFAFSNWETFIFQIQPFMEMKLPF